MFVTVAAVLIGSLTMASGNDILNIGHFKSSRAALVAAEGATQTQMNAMRYVYSTTCPGSPYTLNGVSVVVTCTATANPASSASRAVTFTASPQAHRNEKLISAQVSYDDFSASFNTNNCLSSNPSPTTCGAGMTVNSWVLNPGT
jgi:hypothetical protein